MGSVFWLPYARINDWYGAPQLLKAAGFTTFAMTLSPDSIELQDIPRGLEKAALIVGSEGHGLTAHWSTHSDYRVKIPMAPQIDSLNVASSVAVACWELQRRQ